MMLKQRSGPLGWIALVLAVVVVAALTTLLVVQLTRTTSYRISAREQAAMNAAAQDSINVASFSRKTFDADWSRAVKSTSGKTLAALTPLKDSTQSTLNDAKADLSADITSVALESSNADTVIVLVAFDGYKVDDSGTKTKSSINRLELHMKQAGSTWTIDDTIVLGV